MSTDIILCGVGGQGTILASKLIAAAAMKKNVFSHLRLGKCEGSPLIGKKRADLIIAFEPAEAVRQMPFLKEGGSVVVSSHPILPVSAMIGDAAYDVEGIMDYLRHKVDRLTVVDSEAAARELGSMKVLNVVLLGAAVRSGALGLSEQDILAAIHERVPARFHELNEKALAFAR